MSEGTFSLSFSFQKICQNNYVCVHSKRSNIRSSTSQRKPQLTSLPRCSLIFPFQTSHEYVSQLNNRWILENKHSQITSHLHESLRVFNYQFFLSFGLQLLNNSLRMVWLTVEVEKKSAKKLKIEIRTLNMNEQFYNCHIVIPKNTPMKAREKTDGLSSWRHGYHSYPIGWKFENEEFRISSRQKT